MTAVTRMLAAADEVQARIVDAENTAAAVEEIKRLHAPVAMPLDGGLLMLCGLCCFDEAGRQTGDCADSHHHDGDPTRAACSTVDAIVRRGL